MTVMLEAAPPNLVQYQKWDTVLLVCRPILSLGLILLLWQMLPLPPDSVPENAKWIGLISLGVATWLGLAVVTRACQLTRLLLLRKFGLTNGISSTPEFAIEWAKVGAIGLPILALSWNIANAVPGLEILLGGAVTALACIVWESLQQDKAVKADFEGRIPLAREDVMPYLEREFATAGVPITWFEMKSGARKLGPNARVQRMGGYNELTGEDGGQIRYEISITDTMLDTFSVEAIAAVCWHEFGHAECCTSVMTHLVAGLGAIPLFIAAIGLPHLVGVSGTSLHSLPVFFTAIGSAFVLWRWIFNACERREERIADAYAVDHVSRFEGMIEALVRSREISGQNPRPLRLRAFMTFDHPPLQERMDFAHKRWEKRQAKEQTAA